MHADAAAQHARALRRQFTLPLRVHHASAFSAELQAQLVARQCSVAGRLRQQARLHAQRQALCRGLAQRHRQVGRQADQAAGELPFELAAHHAERQAIRGLAAEVRGGARQSAQLGCAPQAVGAGAALQGEAQAAVALASAVNAEFAAERAGAARLERETVIAKADAGLGVGEQWHVRPQPQVVAGQQQLAAHARALALAAERNVQRQLQIDRRLVGAGCRGLGQRAVDPAADRCGIDEAQRVVERAAAAAFDAERGLVRQVADAAADARELQGAAAHGWQPRLQVAQLHRALVEHQLALHVGERRPGGVRVERGAGLVPVGVAGQVGEAHAFKLGGDAELARRRRERKAAQVAAHLEVDRARLPALHRALDVPAHRTAQRERQVARHARGIGLHQLAAEIEHAGKAPAAVEQGSAAGPLRIEAGPRIGVGQARIARAQLDARGRAIAAGIDAPHQAGVQSLERHARQLEHAGELERAVAQGNQRLAAGFGGAQVDVGALHTRAARAGQRRVRGHGGQHGFERGGVGGCRLVCAGSGGRRGHGFEHGGVGGCRLVGGGGGSRRGHGGGEHGHGSRSRSRVTHRLRRQRQPAHARLDKKTRGRFERAFPARLDRAGNALRRQAGDVVL